MPNKNYQAGRRKEYQVKKEFEGLGYEVLRTAGSHGFADLVAIDKKNKEIIFIQCKPNNFSKLNEERLLEEQKELIGKYETKFYVI